MKHYHKNPKQHIMEEIKATYHQRKNPKQHIMRGKIQCNNITRGNTCNHFTKGTSTNAKVFKNKTHIFLKILQLISCDIIQSHWCCWCRGCVVSLTQNLYHFLQTMYFFIMMFLTFLLFYHQDVDLFLLFHHKCSSASFNCETRSSFQVFDGHCSVVGLGVSWGKCLSSVVVEIRWVSGMVSSVDNVAI